MCPCQPIAERVSQFRRYYARTNERPLLGFTRGDGYPLFRYGAARSLPTDRPIRPDDLDVAGYTADAVRLFQEHEQCGGDFIWSASAFWGIPWVEAMLGCPLYADFATGSISARPPGGFRGADDVPAFDALHPWSEKLGELLASLADASRGQWPIGTTRMRGISDLLSALYGSEGAVFAMLDRPREVQGVCRRLTDLWIELAAFQLQQIPAFHGGIGSFYFNMWAPWGTVWHQEDAVATLSPRLFEEFIAPCDERIVQAFDHCILHTHPSTFLPLEAYLDMGLTAIQLGLDEGGPPIEAIGPRHRRILERKPLLITGRFRAEELEWIFSRLPPQGLAVLAIVGGPEEAQYVWHRHMANGTFHDRKTPNDDDAIP
jgi:hypothetical protein